MKAFYIVKILIFIGVFLFCDAGVCFLYSGNRPANHKKLYVLPMKKIIPTGKARSSLKLDVFVKLDKRYLPAVSSIDRSSIYKDVFWVHNDSVGGPYIYAMDKNGEIFSKRPDVDGKSIFVKGRRNIDWEAIANDGKGNLVVGDVGNNLSNRRNLCFYIFPEPRLDRKETDAVKKVSFYYPTQDDFPDPKLIYDCESCFVLNDYIYFFTKHWTNTETVLWRVDINDKEYQAAFPVARFDVCGMVTDAALSPKHDELAILTYHNIWIFQLPKKDLKGKISEKMFFEKPIGFRKISVPFLYWQVEGIAYASDDLLYITSEGGALLKCPKKEILFDK